MRHHNQHITHPGPNRRRSTCMGCLQDCLHFGAPTNGADVPPQKGRHPNSCADPILSSQHRRQARTCLHMHANDLMTSMCSHRDSAWVQITPPTRTARWSASKNGCRAAATAHTSADSERDSTQHCLYAITAQGSHAYSEHVKLPQPKSLRER